MLQVEKSLPQMRFDLNKAAQILRICRATLHERIRDGLIKSQKDGRRSYITTAELERYVAEKE